MREAFISKRTRSLCLYCLAPNPDNFSMSPYKKGGVGLQSPSAIFHCWSNNKWDIPKISVEIGPSCIRTPLNYFMLDPKQSPGRVAARTNRESWLASVGVCAVERADYCCETLHALIVDTMTRVINGLIPARHIQCAKIANIPDIRNPHTLSQRRPNGAAAAAATTTAVAEKGNPPFREIRDLPAERVGKVLIKNVAQ